MTDIRWKQRFQNYSKAYNLLKEALEAKELSEYSDLEKEGIAQRYEYTFELAWKVLKDYLLYSGINLEQITPRSVIKEAFAKKKSFPTGRAGLICLNTAICSVTLTTKRLLIK